jgi:plasmid stabilization system protein ParE
MNILWSPETIEDLNSLRAYIAQDNPSAARGVVLQIMHSIEQLLPYNPQMGRPGTQSFSKRQLFSLYAVQPELAFSNRHRLLAQERIVIALADGVHHLFDPSRHGGIFVVKCSKPVPACIAARTRLAGASAWSAALAAVDPVGRHLFRGGHCQKAQTQPLLRQ